MNKFKKFHDNAHHNAGIKIKRLVNFVMPLKMFASAIFTGFMILYMVSGVGYAYFTGKADFNYSVPFVFVLQGLLLSALISLLWGLLFSDVLIKKSRTSARLIIFSVLLMVLLSICVLTFMAIPTDWANLWLITNGCIGLGVILFAIINEVRFKATGRRYTEVLNRYKVENFTR